MTSKTKAPSGASAAAKSKTGAPRALATRGRTGAPPPAAPPAPVRHLFGTDGIRGIANESPMTPELALQLGRAVTFVAGRGKSHAPRIIVGKDTRLSGYMIETAIASASARWAAA